VILSLDTSTLTLSLALLERGPDLRVVEEIQFGPPRKVSEMLPGVIGELLSRHGVEIRQLEGICVGLGPGSFTGLRIGVATAKALAYASRFPVAGASSLAAAAMEGPLNATLMPIAVARQQELYVGNYRRTDEGITVLEPEDAMTPAEFATKLLGHPDAVALGPAVPEYRAQLEGLGVPKERLLDVGVVPSAVAVARLARMPETFDAQAVFALEPHYVRASAAERNPKFPPEAGPAPTARIRED
jgi:tRNA threonylcarbamoyladenosine biosynthesis protein TsaB